MIAPEKDGGKASLELKEHLEKLGIETAWDRLKKQLPQCKFGSSGICCRNCNMGPCRITAKADRGVCGADANTIGARNFLRLVAGGAAAHSDHGRAAAELLLETARGHAQGYQIKDEEKLHEVAEHFGIKTEGRKKEEIAEELALAMLAEFGKAEGTQIFAKRAPESRQKVWEELGVTPRAIDREIVEAMHRTSEGVDQEYRSIIRHAHRTALGDGWGGSMIATEVQDILFGTPKPVLGPVDLGVLKEDEVNVVVHGHEPSLSEMIALAAQDEECLKEAEKVGAKGINIAGICCTANELLMRHGIPVAGNMRMQELAVGTGVVDAMIVDVQCIMQGLSCIASVYHTKFISTSSRARIEGATHIQFNDRTGYTDAKKIVMEAVRNFPNRDKSKIFVPKESTPMVVGFSHETIMYMLGGRFRSSYRPLNDNIINGRIRGVVGVVGCVQPKGSLGESENARLVKQLVANDCLVVQTGCAALECGKHGFLLPEYREAAGPGLREVCETVGMPPVLHAGSCVDNSRILRACAEIVKEGGLGDDISQLPVAGACIGWMHEKAISIGHFFVASGVFTVFGTNNPVSGCPDLLKYLTEELEEEIGGKWAFETDVDKMAQLIIDHINKKRAALGIDKKRERVLYDMEARRKLEF